MNTPLPSPDNAPAKTASEILRASVTSYFIPEHSSQQISAHARRLTAGLLMLLAAAPLAAQTAAPATAPVLPDTIARSADGVVVRAVRLDAPIRLDGVLDESVYERVRPASGFIQIEPDPGAPAGDQTEVWVTFDSTNVYVTLRCFDADMNIVATEMRRDNPQMFRGNDHVMFVFDTFYDRRNALGFLINSIGGRMDGQVSNENQFNRDWNAIWDVATGRFEKGWTVEAAIPFKSLRYASGGPQTWGFNVLRPSRTLNEISFLTKMPPARGQAAFQMMSLAATLVGLEAPPSSRTFEVKPYLTSSATTNVPNDLDKLTGDAGVDAKIGVTQGVTADVTYRTDFAQVEADEQQVNLTRFSLFFPEKREFFLENAGTFSFGGVAVSGQNAGGDLAPIFFYSRRIGLQGGQMVPLRVGGRVTGRAGAYSLGALSIRSDEVDNVSAPATTFSVVRLKRDILRRSAVGVLATARSVSSAGTGNNNAFGVDGTFGFFESLSVNTYWARTHTDGPLKSGDSYRAQLEYNADRYGVELERLSIDSTFNPEIGFVRRADMRRNFAQFRFSPRPTSVSGVRQVNYTGSLNYIENETGVLETREQVASFEAEFDNDDSTGLTVTRSYEFLPKPFDIASGVTLPVQGYLFTDVQVSYSLAQQRPYRATFTLNRGSFYSGDKTTFAASGGRVRVTNQFSLEPSYSLNQVRLPEGDFTTHLLTTRATYTMTPSSFVSVLMQYNSSNANLSTNARLRWEYQPGSELFVVYSDERNTVSSRYPDLVNRAFIVKVNRLFRF
ncbi:MAG: DUF5916 domain-containing protein [Vicinamibacterales bacterium]